MGRYGDEKGIAQPKERRQTEHISSNPQYPNKLIDKAVWGKTLRTLITRARIRLAFD